MTLIEKLEELYRHWCEREDNSEMFGISSLDARGRNRGIKECIDIVKQHSGWVSISERLPTEKKDYLVYYKKSPDFGLEMVVSTFYPDEQKFDCFNSKITHWAKLPQPPSEVQS